MADGKTIRVKHCLRASCGPALAIAALLTTLAAAWYRMAPDRTRVVRSAVDPTSLLLSSEVAVVRRPGPLAHTSVLREDTLGFLRARHRTSTQVSRHSVRLPRTLLPEHYDLEIRPLFAEDGGSKRAQDDDAYAATVAIRVHCVNDTTSVVLHAGNFSFIPGPVGEPAIAVWQLTNPATAVPVLGTERENESNFLVIKLGNVLKAGRKYVVQMRLSGHLGDARGFYKYHYDLHGKPEHLVVTFFEPTFAREAFPCFDEPDLKATFNVVVVRPSGYHSISTMPLMRSELRERNTVADYFMTSAKMSTYTLAFMVSNYSATKNGIISIWTRPDDAKSANYSAHITPKIVDYFNQLFNVPYALPKMDLIALPSFLVDAMENWGLLAFHRNSLLHNAETEHPTHKIIVATVVAHEVAHQLDQFTVTDMHPIMRIEYASESHPLSVDGNFSTELDALFDRIVYNKASCLLTFRFTRSAHASEKDPVDVKQVMDTWTRQPGYPVVTVVRNYKDGTASISQRHHCTNPDPERLWHIPITYTDSVARDFGNTKPVMWLKTKEGVLSHLPDKTQWIIVNLQSAGYYKVNYDPLNWELLRRQLFANSSLIPVLNRAQLIQDASDLAQAGELNYEIAMGVLEYIRREESYSPLKTFMNSLEDLDGRLRSTEFYSKWQAYMSRQLRWHYDRLTWTEKPDEEDLQKLLRKDVVFWSCQFNYRPCINHCVGNFRAFMNNSKSLKNSLSEDLTTTMVVLCHAIRTGDNTDWRFLLDHLRDADTADQGHVIVSALGCSKDAKNLERLLSFTVRNMSKINKHMSDSASLFFESVTFSPKGTELALDFLMDNWKPLLERYGQDTSLRDTVWYTLQSIRRSDNLNRMENFFAKNIETKKNFKKLVRTFQGALELARARMNWVAKNGRTIERWIDRRLLDSAPAA
ncbi:unnamed protein product [Ixodes hexagonus]